MRIVVQQLNEKSKWFEIAVFFIYLYIFPKYFLNRNHSSYMAKLFVKMVFFSSWNKEKKFKQLSIPFNKLPYLWSKFKHMAHWMSISERYKVSSIIFMNSPNLSKVSLQSPVLVFSSIVNLFSKLVVDSPKFFNAMCFDEIFE